MASVRLTSSGSDDPTSIGPYSAAQFTATNASLPLLLEVAFGVQDFQVTGLPAWAESQKYDINAKPEGEGGLTYEQIKPLLQHLLEQRLHLVLHHERKEFAGYALMVAKGGAKLQKSTGHKPYGQIMSNGLQVRGVDLDHFALTLASPAGRPVMDKTGIDGTYDFKLEYASLNDPNPTLPSVFVALQEQLGLKLEPQKVPLDTLVIDHVDRVPIEN